MRAAWVRTWELNREELGLHADAAAEVHRAELGRDRAGRAHDCHRGHLRIRLRNDVQRHFFLCLDTARWQTELGDRGCRRMTEVHGC